jgi:hypothetical protein
MRDSADAAKETKDMTAVFCDGLRDVTILNGVVRMEFHRLEAAERGKTAPELRAVPELVVALPTQSFVDALEVLEKARDQLAGELITRLEAPVNSELVRPRRSPNFP